MPSCLLSELWGAVEGFSWEIKMARFISLKALSGHMMENSLEEEIRGCGTSSGEIFIKQPPENIH